MSIFYSDSKTDVKLRYDNSIKFQLFEGAQDVFSKLMAVCCMLTTPQFLQITPSVQEARLWTLL
jgi:hypothetical protein